MRAAVLLFFVAFGLRAAAQHPLCNQSRFYDDLFEVDTLPDIKYGEATSADGNTVELFVDFYLPEGDASTNRPVVLLAHGGSFISGTRKQFEITDFCHDLARRGYVAGSISYRLQPVLMVLNNDDMIGAVGRAVQDGKAAVRFLRRSVAENGNPYGIDTNVIFIGGSSAGGVLGLHVAYLDDESEFSTHPDILNFPNLLAELGTVEGTSGNPGYSSRVNGVINLCGALGAKEWMQGATSTLPVVSVHGSEDDVVPFGSGSYEIPFLLSVQLEGSDAIHTYATANSLHSAFKAYWGQGHVPYVNNPGSVREAYFDTTSRFIAAEAYEWVCNEAAPVGRAAALGRLQAEAFPNPARLQLQVRLPFTVPTPVHWQLLNTAGQRLAQGNATVAQSLVLERQNWPAGAYWLRLSTPTQRTSLPVVWE